MRYLLTCVLLVVTLPAGAASNLRILLTNDDGYESPGIQALHKALLDAGHDVYLIAPATQQSGASASVSARGVKVTAYPNKVWAVEGRPADAVRVGIGNIMWSDPPDLVVSGANFGQNTGQDVGVSGTVGAAVTAHRLGVPAIAVSVGIRIDEMESGFPSTFGAFDGAARLVARLISNLRLSDLTAVLNVNYPALLPLDVRGVRWTGLSEHSMLGKRYNQQSNGLFAPEIEPPQRSARAQDAESLESGFVTLTFLDGDMSTQTRRAQRYLDQHLLDRSYEPAPVQRPAPAPAPRPAPEPVAEPEPPVEPVVQEPIRTPEPMQSPATATVRPSPPPAPAQVREPTPAAPTPAPAPAPTELKESKPARPAINLAVEESPPAPPEESSPPPEAGDTEAKKKPDSWLRRMFNPSSWRR